MTHDHWTNQLSGLLDDDLPREERLAIEGHLLQCDACRRTLAELGAVRAAARTLPAETPARDLWPGIAAAIDRTAEAPRRHVRVPLVWAIAAGVLLAVSSSMTAWLIFHRPQLATESAAVEPEMPLRPVSVAPVPYGHAVDDLMGTLKSRRDQLNPRTVEVLERSLATIDQAIADAVGVLRQYPDDLALVQRVAEQRRLKLAVLRQVERLTAAPEQ